MNTIKIVIPLVEIAKLVPGLPEGKVETVAKWEGNAVLTYSSAEINHNLPYPMPAEEWLGKNAAPARTLDEQPEPDAAPVPIKITAKKK